MLNEGKCLRCSYREFRDGDEVGLEELLKNTFPGFKEEQFVVLEVSTESQF